MEEQGRLLIVASARYVLLPLANAITSYTAKVMEWKVSHQRVFFTEDGKPFDTISLPYNCRRDVLDPFAKDSEPTSSPEPLARLKGLLRLQRSLPLKCTGTCLVLRPRLSCSTRLARIQPVHVP